MIPSTTASAPAESSTPGPAAAPNTRPRRTPAKPVTPGPSSHGMHGAHRPRTASSDHKKAKPTLTSSLNFPQDPVELAPYPAAVDEEELGRNSRRSKVEAISRIDRVGTPVQIAAGPAATSFVPASATASAQAPTSGPSVNRNPLHRPPIQNPPFNIDTVRTEAPRYPSSRSGTRLFGLEECPTYYPTPEQFTDCMAYIESISPEAKQYGICKIVPPEGWRMPFALDTDKFRFKTRLQRLNSLEAASRAKINFLEQLQLYLEQGDSKLHIPVIDRRPLDLYALRKAVGKIGGHEEVNRMGGWGIIAKTLGYDERYALTIKATYMRIILPFDTFANGGKAASESPLTPMPSTMASKPPGFVNESPASPTRPVGRMGGGGRPPPSFAKNGESSRSVSPPVKPLQLPSGPVRDLPPFDAPAKPESSASSTTTLRIKVPGFSSRDGSESELSDEDPPPAKLQKTVAQTPYQKGEVCEVCRLGHDAPKILLCDSCDKGFHTYCLNPPLSFVPTNEEWYCGPCIFAQGDGYGFDEGEDHSIPSFQARDKAFANYWWSKHPTRCTPSAITRKFGDSIVSEDDVEREFWRLTEDPNDTVEIEYGADVHSTTHGSGSPTLETHPLNRYSKDGWNLNNMPILSESLLRYIRSDISGMTVPWIYVGMMLSAFCWHNEDHYTYSVNYMHWGETKTWYGIPGSDAEKFEETMKSEAPELFEQEPQLLFQLVTMMNPGRISEAGVKVVACDQRPNEFVITFPKAYHCGFNHGINFNEAVNFALPDWLNEGKEAVLRYKMHAKAPVFSHNELLISITLYSETIKTAIWLQNPLRQMIFDEKTRRNALRERIPQLNEQLVEEDLVEEQYQCCTCKGFCYLAQVICSCTKLVACIDHADSLCTCPPHKRSLRKRYTEAQLDEIMDIVSNRAEMPNKWHRRFDDLLVAPRPPLKSMRGLLNDADKIAYPMPEVQDLRALVNRANDWVERVTTLLTRKGAGRKKRKQMGHDDDAGDRNLDTFQALLREADKLAFDAPEVGTLRQVLLSIESFKSEAASIMAAADDDLDLEKCRTTLILGNSLNVDMPELSTIQTTVNRLEWFRKIEEEVDDRTLEYEEVVELLQEADDCAIPPEHATVLELRKRLATGKAWIDAVENLYRSKSIEIDQITALIEGKELVPTSVSMMRELEGLRRQALTWQSTAIAQFDKQGSGHAASRLVKAVRTAKGPLSKISIPEVAELQKELEFHDLWRRDLADTLYVDPKDAAKTLNNILIAFDQNLHETDMEPSPNVVCFCRMDPGPTMVTCLVCSGNYHPKCVGVSAKNLDKPFTCAMCLQASVDDRPSLDAISHFATTERQRFRIEPIEVDALIKVTDIGVAIAQHLVGLTDPLSKAVVCRDFELLAHWHRKLFNLPVTFDARQQATKQRVIFEEWLYKRMMDAKHPVKQARQRARKPKLVLRQAKEGQFSCICSQPPRDALITVTCNKCRQGYHAYCVRAPAECLGPEGKNWRCPCCTVKEAKRLQQGDVIVRVQMSDRIGTNVYIDYRTTINTYAASILEHPLPHVECIVLECVEYIKPIIPEGFHPPSIAEVRATRHEDDEDRTDDGRKQKKRKTETGGASVNGTANGNGTPGINGSSMPASNGTHAVNGHAKVATPLGTPAHPATYPAGPSHTHSHTPISASHAPLKSATPSSTAYPSPVSVNQPRTIFDQLGTHRPANHSFGGGHTNHMSMYRRLGEGTSTTPEGVETSHLMYHRPGVADRGAVSADGGVGGVGGVGGGAVSVGAGHVLGSVRPLTNGATRDEAIDLVSSDREM